MDSDVDDLRADRMMIASGALGARFPSSSSSSLASPAWRKTYFLDLVISYVVATHGVFCAYCRIIESYLFPPAESRTSILGPCYPVSLVFCSDRNTTIPTTPVCFDFKLLVIHTRLLIFEIYSYSPQSVQLELRDLPYPIPSIQLPLLNV